MTRIELHRRMAGVSQTQLGKSLGLNPTAIVQVERGHRKPWPKFRAGWSAAFNRKEADFFDESGWPIAVEMKSESFV